MKNRFTLSHICFIGFLSTYLPAKAQPEVFYNSIAAGLSEPLEVVNAGDNSNRLFIVQKGGIIRIWNGNTMEPTPFLDISGLVTTNGERGLLSMAFHPNYETNGLFYVYYTNKPDGAVTVAQYQVSANANIASTTETPLIPPIAKPGTPAFDNHNGGHLQFRTEGGVHYLYFATGDGGSGGDPFDNAQNAGSLLGKMLRIDVDNAPNTAQIFASGLRNPFRWSFDRLTKDMWIGDVGEGTKEEVSFLAAATSSGANFGWDCYEGTLDIKAGCDLPGRIVPIFEYDNPPDPNTPRAVTGGYIYRGSDYPQLYGYYIVSDFYTGQMWLLNSNGSVASTQSNLAANIGAYGEDEDGELYAVSLGSGQLFKISAPFPLPIILVSLTAKQFSGYNEIRWKTSFEQNVNRYIIEHSTDGRNFLPIGEMAALNSSSGYSYSYRHYTTETKKYFYRIRTLDIDGRIQYSRVIAIGGAVIKDVIIYPTILRNNLLEVNTAFPINKLSVFGSDGKEVYRSNISGVVGYFSFQLPSLPKGLYLVNLKGKDFNLTEKIIIQ